MLLRLFLSRNAGTATMFIIYRALGTYICTLSAVDAFVIADMDGIHPALCNTCVAAGALILINGYTEEGDWIKQ